MKYLITGATGNVGSLVVTRLVDRGERPRVFVRDRKKAYSRYGEHVDIFTGDLADAATMKHALTGVDALLLITSGHDLGTQDEAVAEVARDAGVAHLVKLSSYDAREQDVGTGVWHSQGESAIRASGIAHTFVQPSGFMTNALFWARSIKADGVVRTATGDGKIPFIHPQDSADVTVEALACETHRGSSLPITGPEALSYAEMAAKIGAVIGKTIQFDPISEEDVCKQQVASGVPPEMVEAHLSIFRAIRDGRLAMVTDTVKRVLGRNSLTFDHWVGENAQAFR